MSAESVPVEDRSRQPWPRPGAEAGTVSIEFAIVMSAVLVTFFSLLIVAGRVQRHENDVASAAQAAARAASLVDDFANAQRAVEATAMANLADDGVTCVGLSARIISPEDAFGPGGLVTVEVDCEVKSLPLIGRMETAPAVATEVIDVRRGEP